MYNILFFLYQVVRIIRTGLLFSVFGTVSHCKHNPSCGTYFFSLVQTQGLLKSIIPTCQRVWTCR